MEVNNFVLPCVFSGILAVINDAKTYMRGSDDGKKSIIDQGRNTDRQKINESD
jgi:hypothetical protein